MPNLLSCPLETQHRGYLDIYLSYNNKQRKKAGCTLKRHVSQPGSPPSWSPWGVEPACATPTADRLQPTHHLPSSRCWWEPRKRCSPLPATGLITYMQQRLSVINTSSSCGSLFIMETPTGNPHQRLQPTPGRSPNVAPRKARREAQTGSDLHGKHFHSTPQTRTPVTWQALGCVCKQRHGFPRKAFEISALWLIGHRWPCHSG